MAVWTFTLTAVYASSSGSLVRTVFQQSGSVTRVDGSAVPPITQGGSVVQRVTTDGNGSVQFTVDRAAWGTGAPEVLVDFGPRSVQVKADEYGEYLQSIATGSSAASIDAHLGGDATDLLVNLPATYATWTGNRVAFLGDSITAGSWQNSTNYQATSYPFYTMLASQGRVTVAANAGVGGNTSAQALARFDTDVTPSSPNVVVTLLGTNDTGQGVALATFQANIREIVRKTRVIGARPVIGTIPPNNTSTRHTPVNVWNAWLRRYAASEGVPLIDFYAVLADPANGNYLAAYYNDGTHPNEAGYLAMGQAANTVLATVCPPGRPYMSADNTDAVNMLTATNSVMLTDADANGVPDGWFAYGGSSGYAHALITQSGVTGKMAQITQTANGSLRALQKSASGWNVGDKLAISGFVNSDGGVTVQVKTSFAGAGTSGQAANFKGSVTAGAFYQELTVPAGTTGVTVDLIAGAGTGVAAWGQVTVVNLTTNAIL